MWEKKVVEGKVQVKVGRALHLHGTSGGQECDFEYGCIREGAIQRGAGREEEGKG